MPYKVENWHFSKNRFLDFCRCAFKTVSGVNPKLRKVKRIICLCKLIHKVTLVFCKPILKLHKNLEYAVDVKKKKKKKKIDFNVYVVSVLIKSKVENLRPGRKLGKLGILFPTFSLPNFRFWPNIQNRKLGRRKHGKRFPSFRFTTFQNF